MISTVNELLQLRATAVITERLFLSVNGHFCHVTTVIFKYLKFRDVSLFQKTNVKKHIFCFKTIKQNTFKKNFLALFFFCFYPVVSFFIVTSIIVTFHIIILYFSMFAVSSRCKNDSQLCFKCLHCLDSQITVLLQCYVSPVVLVRAKNDFLCSCFC